MRWRCNSKEGGLLQCFAKAGQDSATGLAHKQLMIDWTWTPRVRTASVWYLRGTWAALVIGREKIGGKSTEQGVDSPLPQAALCLFFTSLQTREYSTVALLCPVRTVGRGRTPCGQGHERKGPGLRRPPAKAKQRQKQKHKHKHKHWLEAEWLVRLIWILGNDVTV